MSKWGLSGFDLTPFLPLHTSALDAESNASILFHKKPGIDDHPLGVNSSE